MVHSIYEIHRLEPSNLHFFCDTENDSKHGGLSWFQMFAMSTNTVYLIDICTLREAAFTTAGTNAKTLQDFLQSIKIRKAFYNIIGDSHELWKSYDIHVAAIDDVALLAMAVYTKPKDKGRPRGILTCVAQNTKGDLTDAERRDWAFVKGFGKSTFNRESELKGTPAVWKDFKPVSYTHLTLPTKRIV